MLSNKCPTTQSPVIPLGLLLLVVLEGRGCQKRLALTGCRHTSASASRLRKWLRKCNEGEGDDAISSGSLSESKNEAYVLTRSKEVTNFLSSQCARWSSFGATVHAHFSMLV